jgi:hypothetical protein
MRFSAVLSLVAVVVSAPVASANEPPPKQQQLGAASALLPAVDAQALGITDSILAYCGRLDAAAATKIRARITELEHGASEQQLAAIRNSAQYRQAYDSMVEFVGKVDEHNAQRVCTASAAKSK